MMQHYLGKYHNILDDQQTQHPLFQLDEFHLLQQFLIDHFQQFLLQLNLITI